MDEAKQRVTGVLDEFQKKQDDFMLDAAIKVGGGMRLYNLYTNFFSESHGSRKIAVFAIFSKDFLTETPFFIPYTF